MFKNFRLGFLVLTFLLANPLWSDDKTEQAGKNGHKGGECRQELDQLCGGVKSTGQGEIKKCIEENKSKLSPKCQERVEKRKGKHDKRKACREEMKALCGQVEKGEGRKKKCFEENKSKLSPDCQKMGELIEQRAGKKDRQ